MKGPNAIESDAVWRLGLILLLSAVLCPLSLRAEAAIGRFVIGVWSPAGWSGADRDSYDRFFTQCDANNLPELGVNLLIRTPRIGHKEEIQAGMPLEVGQIDNSTIEMGVSPVIYGLGYRDPVTDQWPSLTRARGVIQAVNSHRLPAVAENGQSQRIDLARIQTLILGETSVSLSASRDTVRAQTEPVDSLAAKEIPPSWWDLENNKGLRRVAKVAAGTGSSIVLAGMTIGVLTSTWEIPDRDDPARHNHGVGVFLYSAAIGSSVGFPFGVSAVDPHDSLPVTLLAGVIPAAAGIGVITIDQERLGTALLLIYFAPVLSSLIVSEVWRNPPEDRGASFGLAPTFNGGFSAVTTLRF